MVILHHGGIPFASIYNKEDLKNVLISSGVMQTYTYTQMRLPSEISKNWTIACYNRQDFLELLNNWNRLSPNQWQYFESK